MEAQRTIRGGLRAHALKTARLRLAAGPPLAAGQRFALHDWLRQQESHCVTKRGGSFRRARAARRSRAGVRASRGAAKRSSCRAKRGPTPPRVCISRCGSRFSELSGIIAERSRTASRDFCAAIGAALPRVGDQRRELVARGARAQRRAQVDAARGVEAQVPHAIGGQPAAIAVAAERLGRRRDDAERSCRPAAGSDRQAPTPRSPTGSTPP